MQRRHEATQRAARGPQGDLPKRHVRDLYDYLTRSESQVLSQLRRGHSELSSFLARIGVGNDNLCECGQGIESTRHFLLHCRQSHISLEDWSSLRRPDGSNPDAQLGSCQGGHQICSVDRTASATA
jgi:hypothetical protein